MLEGLFGSEEVEKEEIPEDELCEECGERRATWGIVNGDTELCNQCQKDERSHLVRIRSSFEEK